MKNLSVFLSALSERSGKISPLRAQRTLSLTKKVVEFFKLTITTFL